MRVATLVFAAVLMAAPMALAQSEAPPAEISTETTTSEAPPAPTAAEETPTTPSAEQQVTPAASQAQVCRAGPRSESRLRSRQQVCRTQAEWDALDRARSRSGAN